MFINNRIFLGLFRSVRRDSITRFVCCTIRYFSTFDPLPTMRCMVFNLNVGTIFRRALLRFILCLFSAAIYNVFPSGVLRLFCRQVSSFIACFLPYANGAFSCDSNGFLPIVKFHHSIPLNCFRRLYSGWVFVRSFHAISLVPQIRATFSGQRIF